jgi:hypothetical protein
MPGMTPLGLRYPLQGETVDATSWQNLANDIDTLMTTINTIRTTAFHTPTASVGNVSGTLPISVASSTLVDMRYNNVNWDTASLVNLVANDDRITVGTGVWYVRFTARSWSGMGTLVTGISYIRDTGGTFWSEQSIQNLGSPSSGGPLSCSGVVVNQAASLGIKGTVAWNGAGGPATYNGAALQVYRLREIGDV